MRERPPLSDGALAGTLADGWAVAAASVEFLGLEEVVAAVPAVDGEPWRPLGGFTVLLYPWVEGTPALERGLSDRQGTALGGFVAGCTGPSCRRPWPRR